MTRRGPEVVLPVETEGGHVEPQGRGLGAEWIEVDDDQYPVPGGGVDLGVGDQRRVLDVVKGDVAQLLQSRMTTPDRVERGDPRFQGFPSGRGRLVIAWAQLVLLRIEVLLAASRTGRCS